MNHSPERVQPYEQQLYLDDGDTAAVAAALDELKVGLAPGDRDDGVRRDVFMASLGSHGTRVDWMSSDASVISNFGIVQRRHYDVTIALTATISRGSATAMKRFILTVLKRESSPATE